MLAALQAFCTCSRVAPGLPYRKLSRIDVANRVGSWGTRPIWSRYHFTLSVRMSTPSRRTAPCPGS
eukprot:scaffold1448_cov387-Prasinococcus_capsulatus_cf.AAC.10